MLGAGIDVVDEHANLHAALRRAQNFGGDQLAGEIVVPDVVLDVERALCARGRGGAVTEGHRVLLDQPHGAHARLIAEPGIDHPVEHGGIARWNGVAGRNVVKPGCRGTMGEQRQRRDDREPRHAAADAGVPHLRCIAHRAARSHRQVVSSRGRSPSPPARRAPRRLKRAHSGHDTGAAQSPGVTTVSGTGVPGAPPRTNASVRSARYE